MRDERRRTPWQDWNTEHRKEHLRPIYRFRDTKYFITLFEYIGDKFISGVISTGGAWASTKTTEHMMNDPDLSEDDKEALAYQLNIGFRLRYARKEIETEFVYELLTEKHGGVKEYAELINERNRGYAEDVS
jgi:hypothetical protein